MGRVSLSVSTLRIWQALAVRPLAVTYDEQVQETQLEDLLVGYFDVWKKQDQKFTRD